MTKCPFCHFDNEDGALFCEQCKSDLGNVPFTVPAAVATAEPAGVEEVVIAEAVPVEAVPMGTVEAIPELVAEPTKLRVNYACAMWADSSSAISST